MPSSDLVTQWLQRLQERDQAVAQNLWEGYFQRMVRLARAKLQGMPRRSADEEDVALSAFDSFCRGAEQGRFPKLRDRNDLWQLLVLITCRKAVDLWHHQQRRKRGGGRVLGESALDGSNQGQDQVIGLAQFPGAELTPAFAAQVAEEFQGLLGKIADPELRSVALWKMEGYTTDEIADRLGCVPRTVERKLRRIRTIWGQSEDQP